jgi:D-amino-acid dehydrogenase
MTSPRDVTRGRSGSDLVIVGGGAIGLATALDAARAGARVTLLERRAGLGTGCTSTAAGLLNLSHLTPLANPAALRDGLRWLPRRDGPFHLRPHPKALPWLARYTLAALNPARVRRGADLLYALGAESVDLHARLADQGLPTGMRRRGIVYACTSSKGLAAVRRQMRPLGPHGQRVRMMGGAEARAQEPALAPTVVGAAYCENEAHVAPAAFVRALSGEAVRLGADIRTGTEVLGAHRSRGRITHVETTTGPIHGGTIVLAAGFQSRRLARSLGLGLPVQAAKGYHIDLPVDPADPRQPVYLHEARVVATPMGDRLRLAGTFEIGTDPATIDAVRLAAVRTAASQGLEGLAGRPVLTAQRGLRPCTPDGLPLLGRQADIDNLIVATGHGMVGLVLAPVTAKIVTALAQHAEPGYDLTLTDPDRFRIRPWARLAGARD